MSATQETLTGFCHIKMKAFVFFTTCICLSINCQEVLIKFLDKISQNVEETVLISTDVELVTNFQKHNGIWGRTTISIQNGTNFRFATRTQRLFVILRKTKTKMNILRDIPKDSILVIILYNASDKEEVFSYTWKLRLKNVLIATMDAKHVFVFDPFRLQIFRYGINQTKEIIEFFNFKNYHRHIIKATLFGSVPSTIMINKSYVGIDPMVIQTIEEVLNVTIVHYEPPDREQYGTRYPNGTTTGALKSLLTGASEIAFNQVIKEYNTPELDFTNFIYRDSLCVIVPKAGLVPSWTAIFYSFPLAVWFGIGLSMTVAIFTLFLIRKFKVLCDAKFSHANDHTFSTIFLDVTQIFFSTSYNSIVSSKYYERIFVGAIFVYVLIINTLFQSSLVTVLTTPRYEPNINTLKELEKSKYQILTSSPSLNDTFDGHKGLSKKFYVIPQNATHYKAYIARKSRMNYWKNTTNIHIVKECPRTFLLAYFILKDCYFQKDFDKILRSITEAGLVSKWYQTTKLNSTQTVNYSNNLTQSQSLPRPFTIDDLQTSFYLLLTGLLMSLLCFLFELGYSK